MRQADTRGRWASAVAVLAVVAATATATAAYAEPAGGTHRTAEPRSPAGSDTAVDRRPVVLVHGWLGSPANFDAMRAALTESGYPVYPVLLLGQENVSNAHAIGDQAERASREHGGSTVDLVGHRMGGLSTRYYLKRLGGTVRVHTYVSMGTSQYGYDGACVLPVLLGGQMCPASVFLADLNERDDTPGAVSYTTMWSTEDTVDAARLDGGACFHEIAGVPHADEPRSPAFIAAVREALAGTCPGEYVDLPVS